MSEEKRKGSKAIPDDIKNYLNEDQLFTLRKIEGFGWSLKYIRRPVFLDVVVVVICADGKTIGVLEEDGRLNLETDIEIRD